MLPPSAPGGGWTEVILYSFTGEVDGQLPTGKAFGPDGNLYGATSMVFERGGAGNYGTVFHLISGRRTPSEARMASGSG